MFLCVPNIRSYCSWLNILEMEKFLKSFASVSAAQSDYETRCKQKFKKTVILVFKTILCRHRFQEGNSWKMYQLNCDLVKSEKVEKWKKNLSGM